MKNEKVDIFGTLCTYGTFICDQPTGQTFDRFWRVISQETRNHAEMCLLGL